MRKVLANGLAMGIIALGSVAATSTASAKAFDDQPLTVGQTTKKCNGWAQHSNSAVYWRTCAVIVKKTSTIKYATPVLEVKNVGARSKIVTGHAFSAIDVQAGFTGFSVNRTLPAGQTWTMKGTTWQLTGHGTYYAYEAATVRGYNANPAFRTVGLAF